MKRNRREKCTKIVAHFATRRHCLMVEIRREKWYISRLRKRWVFVLFSAEFSHAEAQSSRRFESHEQEGFWNTNLR
jgi:hypothetical protein